MYLQVINPLPKFNETNEPLAKGLYDFEEEGEDDLLHFKQVNVIELLLVFSFIVWFAIFHYFLFPFVDRRLFSFLRVM